MRLIDADAKIMAQLYDDEHEEWVQKEMTVADYLSFSDTAIPFVDAVPVAHAKWLTLHGDSRLMCSRCKWKEHVPTAMGEPTIWEYCPSCGAKMIGGLTMDDYISREALIKAVEGNPYVTDSIKSYLRCTAKNIPAADVVEVVRCRDCKRGKYDAELNGYWCGGDIHAGAFYCMYGTRLDAQEATT